jgi:DNA repair protein RecN (Recombination protein N)
VLTRLYIENFALLEHVEVEFGPGLNVVTGETGAGKSVLLGALDSILGATVGADCVRTGAERCVVEGLFEFSAHADGHIIDRLTDLDIELEDGQLALRREIRASGRGRAFANGLTLPLRRLKEVGALLVDLCGQHEHQSLLDETSHARFLDESGGLADQTRQVAQLYGALQQCREALTRAHRDRQELQQQEELRRFQLAEIRAIAPQPGEEEELEREAEILANQTDLVQGANQLYQELYQGEASTVEQLGRVRRQLGRLAEIDPSLNERAETADELLYAVEDLAAELQHYANSLDADPLRLERVRERLIDLRRLQQKYDRPLEEVVALVEDLEGRERRLQELEGVMSEADGASAAAAQEFAHACLAQSQQRDRAAESLSGSVEEGLRSLGMPHAAFRVHRQRVEDADGPVEEGGRRYRADENGMESVEFLISANAGEGPRPLTRIASGGEISRIMLVLKEIIAVGDMVSTLVFDEIDVGISGRIAASVGARLERLGRSHQVIVITHLPQIASLARQHFSVRKTEDEGRTHTEVLELDEVARREEIAGLLAGESISAAARQHAREMLE